MAAAAEDAASSRRAPDASAPSPSKPPSKPPWRWHRGRRRAHESDVDASWRARRKHLFILSDAGKPIYARYGDEAKLAGFTAALAALVAAASNAAGGGGAAAANERGEPEDADVLRSITVGPATARVSTQMNCAWRSSSWRRRHRVGSPVDETQTR